MNYEILSVGNHYIPIKGVYLSCSRDLLLRKENLMGGNLSVLWLSPADCMGYHYCWFCVPVCFCQTKVGYG
jgi:hypothetical protein